MLIINQDRDFICNSKDIEYVYISEYYYIKTQHLTCSKGYFTSADYVRSHHDEYPNIQEDSIWMIRTNNYAWTELGQYSTKEKAEYAMSKLINARFIFFMPKDK